jgi:protease IV
MNMSRQNRANRDWIYPPSYYEKKKMIRRPPLVLIFIAAFIISGCAGPKFILFSDDAAPLREFTLQGEKTEKILVISVSGFISDQPRKEFIRLKPSMTQEIVSQLNRAEKDKDIKAVVFKIDSPGGATTASDILYHEIFEYKKRTKVKIIVSMMGVATSGAYYISLPADHIIAHPTTITGSIGVIFLYPRINGLMEKIGIAMEVSKSGKNKDMASPFRMPTEEERRMMQNITRTLGNRFLDLVTRNRKIADKPMQTVSTARIFLPEEALNLGLIDEIGYLNDALSKAKSMAGLPDDAKVIVYRRITYPDDNLYNSRVSAYDIQKEPLIDLGIAGGLSHMKTGFYYLWLPDSAR